MRVILSVDALVPPLTGIGRYSWELASRLGQVPGVAQLRYYREGNWVANPASLVQGGHATPPRNRRKLKPPRWARDWYWQRACKGQVFHAPNYFLPPCAENGVVTVHDLSVFKFPQTHPAARVAQFERSFRQTLGLASHLITDTEAVRQEVMAFFGWPAERVTAVPLGVAPEFRPRSAGELSGHLQRYGLTAGAYTLCVSTIEPRKRIDALLSAYQRLPVNLRAAYPLVLVGGRGWHSEALHAQIDAAQREGWLRYLGFVPGDDLSLLHAGARLFAYPSIYEGFGLPVAEAMASGVPVLTSDRSCLPEVAAGAARLVNPDDGDALAEALEDGLINTAWRAQAVARGLQVAGRYSWDACARRTVGIYSEALGLKTGV